MLATLIIELYTTLYNIYIGSKSMMPIYKTMRLRRTFSLRSIYYYYYSEGPLRQTRFAQQPLIRYRFRAILTQI